jgi:hypothetical protein
MGKERHCVIYWCPARFVIAEGGTWLPGSYATLPAARRAFDLSVETLEELRQRVHLVEDRLITEADLPSGGPGPAVLIRHARLQTNWYRWDEGTPPDLPWSGEEWKRGDLVYEADESTGRIDVFNVKTLWIEKASLTPEERSAMQRGESVADAVTARLASVAVRLLPADSDDGTGGG